MHRRLRLQGAPAHAHRHEQQRAQQASHRVNIRRLPSPIVLAYNCAGKRAEKVTMNTWTNRRRAVAAFAGAVGLGACGAVQAGAPASGPSSGAETRPLDTIVVTAQRLADERLRAEVESALHNEPMLMSDHLEVSIKNGVVTLTGMVFDDWD